MVNIESLEGGLQFALCKHFLAIHDSHEPLTIADGTVVVCIGHTHQLVDFGLVEVLSVDSTVALKKLVLRQRSTAISVKFSERIGKLLSFLLGHKVLNHEAESSLLD